jgi:transposase, IS30 family
MRQYKHLTIEERLVIQKMVWNHEEPSRIAHFLNRDRSSIIRELRRVRSEGGLYRAHNAHELSLKRRKGKKAGRGSKMKDDLFLYVIEKLFKGWSPQLIAGRLKHEYGNDKAMRVSHETIYLYLYKKYKESGITLCQLLPQCAKKRQKRLKKREKRIIIKDRKSINTRPIAAENRSEIGHWEGDTVVGSKSSGYISTLVDRCVRYLVLGKGEDKSAETCNRSILEAFGNISNRHITTITFDNGTEFAQFKDIEEACECQVYFADPYSAWQRGTNENTNRLLRRYFPKGTNFSEITQSLLDAVARELNNRPRAILNYLTPYEAMYNNSVAIDS